MKTYWDHTEAERAQMTEDQVRAFEAYELMEAGIVRAPDPGPFTEPEPKTATIDVVAITFDGHRQLDIGFANASDAERFLREFPSIVWLEDTWDSGKTAAWGKPIVDARLAPKTIRDGADRDRTASAFKRWNAAKQAHEAARRAFEEARQKESAAVHGIWTDWHKQREWHDSLARVVTTFREYTTTAGDATVAAKFLRKAFPESTIIEAAEVFGVEIPPCAA